MTDIVQRDLFDQVRAMTLSQIAPASKRVYDHTFGLWCAFAAEQGFHPLVLSFDNVQRFLDASDVTKATKMRRLSTLRSLAENFELVDPANASRWQAVARALSKIKVTSHGSRQSDRNPQALTKKQVYQAFAVWDDDRLVAARNQAMLAVAFYAGLRRSEIVNLRWQDINLETGLINVIAGKGDKDRTAMFVGKDWGDYILNWRSCVPEGRTWVFCRVLKKGKGRLGDDEPITDQTAYNVMKKCGFSPHDARRTLITSMIESGTSITDAKTVAGHKNPQTTMRYAQERDANVVRSRVKIDF